MTTNGFYGHTISATFEQLEQFFGPSNAKSNDGKVNYIWHLEMDTVPFCLYDWKTKVKPNEKIDWHIGAVNEEESKKVYENLKNFFK